MTTQPEASPAKEAFLQRIRQALGRAEPATSPPDHPPLKTNLVRQEEKLRTIRAKVEARRERNAERLAENATKVGWHVHRVETHDEAAAAVAAIAAGLHARNVVRTAEDCFRQADYDGPLRRARAAPIILASGRNRSRDSLKATAFDADLGVTGVSWAIAETASCVIVPRRGVARLASLAPPVYVAIVGIEQILETLDDYFATVRLEHMKGRGHVAAYANFISGPSRTADIEQTLTVGVHGPGVVHMLIVGRE
ncbi:MAG: hypothetical protein FJ318_05465 [SAR202 cluster bacterium]|nr:hypothetical protein [SAR202 cluster bacterium]